MPDDEAPPPAPASNGALPPPRWWRPERHSRRVLGAGAVLIACALVATVTVLVRTGAHSEPAAPPDPIAATPLGHDPVPAERTIRTIPTRCGVSKKTIHALAPHAEVRDREKWKGSSTMPGRSNPGGDRTCEWLSEPGEDRGLTIDFSLYGPAGAQQVRPLPPATPISQALAVFPPTVRDKSTLDDPGEEPDDRKQAKVKPVAGLGDEAVYFYRHEGLDHDSGQTVVFRVQNAVVSLSYTGASNHSSSGSRVRKRTARRGAFRAAAEVAATLGAHHPAPKIITPKTRPAAFTHTASPCATGSESPEPEPTEPAHPESTKPLRPDECQWKYDWRILTAETYQFPDDEPGGGTRQAIRTYLRLYRDTRAVEPLSKHDERYFTALRGPGQQAFAGYIPHTTPGRVVLRKRNVVVDVTYAPNTTNPKDPATVDEHPLAKNDAVNGAYRTATQIAATLHE